MTWMSVTLFFLGGALGSVLRHAAIRATAPRLGRHAWLALFAVNMLGALAAGATQPLSLARGWPSEVPAAIVALLGGFTSFSALSVLSEQLWSEGRRWAAILQAALPVALAIPMVRFGAALAAAIGS